MTRLLFFICMLFTMVLFVGFQNKVEDLQVNEGDQMRVNEIEYKHAQKSNVKELNIKKRIDTENEYENFHVVTDHEKIEKTESILQTIQVENMIVDHIYPPNFKINEQYYIWVTPQGDVLEVTNPDKNTYMKLSKEESDKLYEIITDEKLSEWVE